YRTKPLPHPPPLQAEGEQTLFFPSLRLGEGDGEGSCCTILILVRSEEPFSRKTDQLMKDPDVSPTRGSSCSVGSTSMTLVERVRSRAPGAWERLSFLYGPLVCGWARRAGLRTEDAADVVQEVFLAVARNLAGFHHEAGDTFRGWLWTIM